jgi:protease I
MHLAGAVHRRDLHDPRLHALPVSTVLIILAQRGFDPTEAGVPFAVLRAAGHRVVVATPNGTPGEADPRMLHGVGLGILKPLLKADARGVAAYEAMSRDPAFSSPVAYADLDTSADALVLPGGHDKPMREYLESPDVARVISGFFAANKPVAAICHGVVAAARARGPDGRSVLHGKKTTALTNALELTAYTLTRAWLGDYYRTYPETVEDEVKRALADPSDFVHGPTALLRDAPGKLSRGFIVRDGHYLSARWPGDAHRFAEELVAMLAEAQAPPVSVGVSLPP